MQPFKVRDKSVAIMKIGDLVCMTGAYRCAISDVPSYCIEDDPGTLGEIIHQEILLILELSGTIPRWIKILTSSGQTGWIQEELVDLVEI